MRILYLAHRLPYPPTKGDKIRTHHMLAHMAKRHEVSCACFLDPPSDAQYAPAVREHCRELIALALQKNPARLRALQAAARGEAASIAYYAAPEMSRALARLGTFDAVIAFSACMGPHALHVPADRRILDLCDLDSAKWRAYADVLGALRSRFYRREAAALEALEKQLYDAFDATILISPAEAADWDIHNRRRLHVIGNGVHLPAARPLPERPLVGFVGDMSYWPNQDGVRYFLDEIWPLVLRAVPRAEFVVAGRHPPRWLRARHGRERVAILGAIPDVFAFLGECRVVTAPLRIARGVQNKVLEAMSAGRPVVATPSAARGIEAQPDEHLWIADDAIAHAAGIVALLSNRDRAAELGERASAHVAAKYRWPDRLARLDELLDANEPENPAKQAGRLSPVVTLDR